MPAAAIPRDEEQRLETLYDYRILDTMEEASFDSVCELAAAVCDTPISLINLIDRYRQWAKAMVGLDLREIDRECAFCAHAILEDDTLVVEDATRDERFSDNPLVLRKPNIRFYAGEPLHGYDGRRLGTLCVIDGEPRRLEDDQKNALRTLARHVEHELELHRLNLELGELDARRDRIAQFVVHDLANPLTAIRMLVGGFDQAVEGDSPLREMVDDLDAASQTAHRLVDDLRDIAVGRAGRLAPRWQSLDLEAVVRHVAATARPACRDAEVSLHWEIDDGLEAEGDPDLVSRVLQNLVFNAIDHSPEGAQVTVRCERRGDESYALCVDDEGSGVSKEARENLFELYSNAPAPKRRTSRGIGLAFCRAAVEAHGGTIEALDRQPRGTTFCAEMPVGRPSGS